MLTKPSHIEALQEVYCLIDSVEEFVNAPGGIERLESLNPDEIATFQQLYWSRVDEAGLTPRRPVFVDKMPLYSVYLCLVARLFPASKILFAVRDPRDVVLSCFRRRLLTTAQMYEVTTIESAATYYDAVLMRLADIYRDKLGLSMLDVSTKDRSPASK